MEVPSPRGGGAQEGQGLAHLDPAVWLELEQAPGTQKGPGVERPRDESVTRKRVCEGCASADAVGVTPPWPIWGNPKGTRDRIDTTPSPRNANTWSWNLLVGSPSLVSITLAPAGST